MVPSCTSPWRTTGTLTLLALPFASAISPLPQEAQDRRTLSRFTRGHSDNDVCWDRDGVDGFISIIDAHQHPMPFGGPEVPFSMYTQWFIEHGVVFSVFMGIGQRIVKQNASLPDCCYYLHCPTYLYPVIPMTESDEINAEARAEHYYGKVDDRLHLILSATFPNLQRSVGAKEMLQGLWDKFPHTFKWMGEINVFKHALAGNGFFSDFTGPRLTVARIEAGELDELFSVVGPEQKNGEHIPTVTIHSDMGCDTYANSIPLHAGDGINDLACYTPEDEKRTAQKDKAWWKATLGEFYHGFFDANDYPKSNFRKIMHIHVTDSILTRYKEIKFVWAHLGLSMELQSLHPAVHAHILKSFYERHATNLWSDMSWDVLAKLNFMNHDGKPIEAKFSAAAHEDLADDSLWDPVAVTAERERLATIWESQKPNIKGTMTTLTGPSYNMAVLLDLLHKYPERPITGTDYVASFGTHAEYPGFTPRTGAPLSPMTGCHKTEQSHAEQLTDTSSLNMFFDDELFAAAVLGGNFFRIAHLSTKFAPPPLCRADGVPTSAESSIPNPPTLSGPISTVALGPAIGAVRVAGSVEERLTGGSVASIAVLAAASGVALGSSGAFWLLSKQRAKQRGVNLADGATPLMAADAMAQPVAAA